MFLCRIVIYDKGIVIPRTGSACQHNFVLEFLRAMLLDGYMCKLPPPLFGLHPSTHAADSSSVSAYKYHG